MRQKANGRARSLVLTLKFAFENVGYADKCDEGSFTYNLKILDTLRRAACKDPAMLGNT